MSLHRELWLILIHGLNKSCAGVSPAVHQSLGGDGMDFVSATVPKSQPQIIKNMANKKVLLAATPQPLPGHIPPLLWQLVTEQ